MRKISGVLAVGAHPDDIELGCGGSLAKFVDRGVPVRAVVLSHGREGSFNGYNRCEETREALRLLGITDIKQYDFPDTKLHESLNDIVRVLERECEAMQPSRMYTMFKEDRHQDHRTTFEASVIAARGVPQILCYETPCSGTGFVPQVVEEISKFLSIKVDALQRHFSQNKRVYMQEDHVRCLAQFRGNQMDKGPSECFVAHKFIL